MSITTCKSDGIYLFEEDGEFEVHLRVASDIKKVVSTEELHRRVNNSLLAYDICARISAFWCGDEIHFKTCNFTPWTDVEVDLIWRIIQSQNSQLSNELRFKKRMRQVRDAFNKCKNADKIEQIAQILEV